MDVGQDAAGRDSDAAEKLNAASRQGRRVSVVLRRQWRMAGRVGGAENGRKSTKITHLVELLVVADGQLDVAGDDTGLLVVAGRVTSELKDLGAEILEDRGEVDRGTSPDARGGSLQVAVDASDRELEPSLTGAGLGSRLGSLLSASALALA